MPGEEKVWLRDIRFTACIDRNDNGKNNGIAGKNGDKNGNADDNHSRPYDVNEMVEMQQTTQPLIGLGDRDINGYKDKISGSSRYASTTSTLADEKLWIILNKNVFSNSRSRIKSIHAMESDIHVLYIS